ncbi:MAG: hypothetical protein P8Y23_12450, partial [Candidatus Lokiarchaeota archaeon]
IGKILILGDKMLPIYKAIKQVCPNAYYVLSNESLTHLDQFINHFEIKPSIELKELDIFNGSSLTDFYLEFGKFDLILLSGIFEKHNLNKRKIRNSVVFLHKNFLNLNGIFCILNDEKILPEELVNILKKIRAFRDIIKSYQQQDKSLRYLIFKKKSRLKLFGD